MMVQPQVIPQLTVRNSQVTYLMLMAFCFQRNTLLLKATGLCQMGGGSEKT